MAIANELIADVTTEIVTKSKENPKELLILINRLHSAFRELSLKEKRAGRYSNNNIFSSDSIESEKEEIKRKVDGAS